MKLNRRNFVVGAGSALAVAGLSASAGADDSIPVEIANVYPVADVVILRNTGDEDVDLGGYVMDWEYGEDLTQEDTIPSGTTIAAGQTLSVWTGFQSTQIPDVEADVRLDEYGNGRINASEPDTIALVTSSGDLVSEAAYEVDGPAYNADEYDEEPEDVDEEPEEEPEEEPGEADLDIDVSVSSPDADRGTDATFHVTTRNHGGASAETTLCLEVGGVSRSATIKVGAGGCQTKRFSVPPSELSEGKHSWKVWTTTEDEKNNWHADGLLT